LYIITNDDHIRFYDGYIQSKNLLIEVDSVHWHSSKKAIKNDALKTKLAIEHGYKLERIVINEVQDVEKELPNFCARLEGING
jgi:very-short-patch-repair endonuclease